MSDFGLEPHGGGEARPHFSHLVAMFDHAVATAPDVTALIQSDCQLTYAQESAAVTALAGRLTDLGATGCQVALLLPNSINYHIAFYGALKAGAVPVLINPAYPPAALAPLLEDAEAAVLIAHPDLMATVAAVSDGRQVVVLGAEGLTLSELIDADPAAAASLPEITGDSPAALLYTGGTTGLSKGVPHSHKMLMTAVKAMEWGWPTRRRGEVWLPVAPMSHIYGFLMGVTNPVFGAATIVIPDRFEPNYIVELLMRHKVTIFGGGPPAIYNALLAAENFAASDLSALRVCPAGGAPFPVELLRRWQAATGRDIFEGYGMTEVAPISVNTSTFGRRPGSVGKPVPCNRVDVVDLETGETVLPPGTSGEIRVQSPYAMAGYRNRADETEAVLRHGWIYSGDIGHLDEDGFLIITDRKKDVIFVKGFNVFPREVEEVLYQNPEVAAVGVVGVPDSRAGEKVVAFVVRKDDQISAETLLSRAADRLVDYKLPAEIRFVADLPMTPAKKLDRIHLKKLAADGAQ